MSDQGAFSHGNDFGLIETLLWTPQEGFWLLDEHLARLGASCAALGFVCDEERVHASLAGLAESAAPRLRARIVVSRDGAIAAGATPIEATPPDTEWRLALARRRFDSADPMLRHKTTRRALYEDELAEAQAREQADEVLFLNERSEVCEAARCSVFVARDDHLATPPLACGLLPGTLRASLLASGRARETVLRLEDVSGDGVFLGNSVRGLVRARMI